MRSCHRYLDLPTTAHGPDGTRSRQPGFYERRTNKQKVPRLQLRTVKELTEGKRIERPTSAASLDDTFKKAPESKKKRGEQNERKNEAPHANLAGT